MGAGKTTVGRELAKLMSLQFIDLDHFVENRYNKTISQLFADVGEEKFREIENKALKEICNFEDVIISTGGGSPCFFDNMEIMNTSGITVYLKADPVALSKRLNKCKDKRPLIKQKNEEELLDFIITNLEKRDSFYYQAKIISETNEFINKEEIDLFILDLQNKINTLG